MLVTQSPASPNHSSPTSINPAHPFVSRHQLRNFSKLYIRLLVPHGPVSPRRFSCRRPCPNSATSPTSCFHGLSIHGFFARRQNLRTDFGADLFRPPSETIAILRSRVRVGAFFENNFASFKSAFSSSVRGHRHSLRSRNHRRHVGNSFASFKSSFSSSVQGHRHSLRSRKHRRHVEISFASFKSYFSPSIRGHRHSLRSRNHRRHVGNNFASFATIYFSLRPWTPPSSTLA